MSSRGLKLQCGHPTNSCPEHQRPGSAPFALARRNGADITPTILVKSEGDESPGNPEGASFLSCFQHCRSFQLHAQRLAFQWLPRRKNRTPSQLMFQATIRTPCTMPQPQSRAAPCATSTPVRLFKSKLLLLLSQRLAISN